MAHQLNLDFEIVQQTKGITQTYVYYESSDKELIPPYCGEAKR